MSILRCKERAVVEGYDRSVGHVGEYLGLSIRAREVELAEVEKSMGVVFLHSTCRRVAIYMLPGDLYASK